MSLSPLSGSSCQVQGSVLYHIHVTGQGNRRWNAVAAGDHEHICEGNWPVNDDGGCAVPHGAESEGLE